MKAADRSGATIIQALLDTSACADASMAAAPRQQDPSAPGASRRQWRLTSWPPECSFCAEAQPNALDFGKCSPLGWAAKFSCNALAALLRDHGGRIGAGTTPEILETLECRPGTAAQADARPHPRCPWHVLLKRP